MRRSPITFSGDLMHRRQYAANTPRYGVVRYRTIGHREVSLFGEAVAVDLEREVFHPGRRAAVEGSIDEWAQHIPYLGPHCAHGLTHGPRMLDTKHRHVGVVVEANVVRPPPQKLREAIGQHERHHHAQCEAPARRITQWRGAPVDFASESAAFGVVRNEIQEIARRGLDEIRLGVHARCSVGDPVIVGGIPWLLRRTCLTMPRPRSAAA